MKKLLFANIIFLFVFFGYTFADMQNNFFCTISPDLITVTMERKNNHKCSQYLRVLSQSINKEYKDVIKIQELIKQGYDLDFWTDIREKKRSDIKRMLIIKEQIELSVQKFDDNLFSKIKEYLIYSSSPYRLKYKKIIKHLEKLEWDIYIKAELKNKISLMQEQLQVIDIISISDDYETLMKNFNRYIYLKKQIEWK